MSATNASKEKDVEEFFNISGASMNHTRKTTASPHRSPSRQDKVRPPHIDLYNFDDPKFEEGKYVLTSPRSLEACSRFNIKPVELLYKPLIDYQEELLPQGYSLRTIYEIFDQQEKERLNTLQLCREERERVIIEDRKLGVTEVSGPVIKPPPGGIPQQPTLSQKSSVRERKYASDGESDGLQTEDEDEKSAEGGKAEDGTADVRGSAQRRRTAWTTSIGHDRVTPEELEQRAKELYEKGRETPKKPRRRPKSASGKTKSVLLGQHSKRPASAGPVRGTGQTYRKKQARLKKSEGHLASVESITDGASVTSSRASRPWIKDPMADAKPVTDPVLRSKISSVTSPGGRISAKKSAGDGSRPQSMPVMRTADQKILQLMITKREAERKEQAEREKLRSKWEEDRRKEAANKSSANSVRRRSSASERKHVSSPALHQPPPHQNGCAHGSTHNLSNGANGSCSCGRDHDREVTTPGKCGRRPDPTTPRQPHNHTEGGEPSHRRSWIMASEKKLRLQKQQLQEKKQREMERKKSVEKRLEEQRREKEEKIRKVQEKQTEALQRAESIRISKEQQKELTTRLRNFQKQTKHKEKMQYMKMKSMEDLSSMRASIDLKNHLARSKQQDLDGLNQNFNKRRSVDLDARLRQSRDNKARMDREVAQWQEDLHQYQRTQEERAAQKATQRKEEKARKAAESRGAKTQAQTENMKKLLTAEEAWKAEVEASIALKDSKARMLQREKEEAIMESRALAQTTQRLREDLKSHYSMNDLDKLNKQAEMENRYTLRSPTPGPERF